MNKFTGMSKEELEEELIDCKYTISMGEFYLNCGMTNWPGSEVKIKERLQHYYADEILIQAELERMEDASTDQ